MKKNDEGLTQYLAFDSHKHSPNSLPQFADEPRKEYEFGISIPHIVPKLWPGFLHQ